VVVTEAGFSSNLAHSLPPLWHFIGITGISCCENVEPLAVQSGIRQSVFPFSTIHKTVSAFLPPQYSPYANPWFHIVLAFLIFAA